MESHSHGPKSTGWDLSLGHVLDTVVVGHHAWIRSGGTPPRPLATLVRPPYETRCISLPFIASSSPSGRIPPQPEAFGPPPILRRGDVRLLR
jgi:hypothetical protein